MRIPVIFVTMARTADAAIEAMKQGAYDYLFKPLDPRPIAAGGGRGAGGGPADANARPSSPNLAGTRCRTARSSAVRPAMREVYKAIGRVAAQDVPVLITGESGTGKELVARAIYQHSRRAEAPFLALNCAAIPETLLESELFGHEKGAFTGAERRRIGKFEQCHGGTLFLDEIGDMPPALQAKVLRLLQEQAFERVGGNETVRTDVRLIAATHRDLKAWSAEGKFRPDLYYRLGVFTIHLPPLRERGDDLPLLVRHYLRRFGRELGREVREVAPEAMERLRRYSWPGNIRELQSVLKQALLRASGTVLLPAFLPEPWGNRLDRSNRPHRRRRSPAWCPSSESRLGPDACDLYAEAHRRGGSALADAGARICGGNQHRAARLLGIARQTLRSEAPRAGAARHAVRRGRVARGGWDDAPRAGRWSSATRTRPSPDPRI